MSRQSQTNTFNEGLNKDLNPILTPNNVMTDCLNGTIITYNGNEFALQNDLGNYKFKHGSLSQGFVPVGIKEHANILYIISYNPISDEVEVGSFPSMKLINSSTIKNDKGSSNIRLEEIWNNYTDIETSLTFLSDLSDDYILNPGDQYIIIKEAEEHEKDSNGYKDHEDNYLKWKADVDKAWVNTSLFVYTENKKLYNIDDYIKWNDVDENTTNNNDFKPVNWEIPGWLVVKPAINVMDEFNCYIDDQYYHFNDNGEWESTSSTIKIQSTWNHSVYGDVINDYVNNDQDLSIINNLGYLVYSYNDSKDSINWLDIIGYNNDTDTADSLTKWEEKENKVVNYNGIHDVIYSSIKVHNCKDDYLAIVPVLRVNTEGKNESDMDNDDKFIIYDQFTTVLKLKKEKFDPATLKIGESLFKYYIGKDSMTMHLSVESNAKCRLFYRILTWKSNDEMVSCFDWQELAEFDHNGQNIFSIDYSGNGDYGFYKEDFYVIQFYVSADNDANLINTFNDDNLVSSCLKEFVIYCSEFVNMYYRPYDSYISSEFTLNEESFAAAVENGLKVENPIESDIPEQTTIQDIIYEYKDSSEKLDLVYTKETNTIEQNEDLNDKLKEDIIVDESGKYKFDKFALFRYGSAYIWNFQTGISFNIPTGDGRLWKNIIASKNQDDFIISAYDNNYNVIGLEYGENEEGKTYSLPIVSESKLYIDPQVEVKEGPSQDNIVTFGNIGTYRPVTLLDDGYWKLNYVAIIWKDNNREDTNCSTTYIAPSLEIKFKVIDNDTISVIVGNDKLSLLRNDEGWEWSGSVNFWDSFFNCDSKSVFKFKDWKWTNNAGWSKNSLENHISCPWLVVARNNTVGDGIKFFDSSNPDFNGFNIFRRPYHYDTTSSNIEIQLLNDNDMTDEVQDSMGGREHMFVGVPISRSDVNNNFSTIFTVRSRSWNLDLGFKESRDTKNVQKYLDEMFAIYFLMVDRIRYCKKSEVINKYILNFDTKHSTVSKRVIKSIEYKLSNTDWEYELDGKLIHRDININISDLKKHISNLVFSEEININKVFHNMNNDIQTAVDKYKTELNDDLKVNTDIINLQSMNEIRSNQFYLTTDGDGYNFDSLLEIMKFENGKIIYQSPMSWPDTFNIVGIGSDSRPIGSIGSYFFKE